jgi:hypothetical protein
MLLSAALRHRSAFRALHPRLSSSRCFSVDQSFVQAHTVYVVANSGHAIIPPKFVLTGKAWPSDLEGYNLGKVAAKYRQQYRELNLPHEDFQQLDGVGFAWCSNEWQWENVVVPALLKYKELHGDMHVPRRFVVPSSEPWPDEMWEMALGNTVNNIRSSGQFVRDDPERRQWLEEKGFVFDVPEMEWEAARCALATYKEVHGDMRVPYRFVVPSGEPWAEEVWEMKLGKTVNNIRSSGHFVRDDPERRQVLDDMGFVWKVKASAAEKIRDAAAHYGRVRRGAVAV